jgi:hypothetical protein
VHLEVEGATDSQTPLPWHRFVSTSIRGPAFPMASSVGCRRAEATIKPTMTVGKFAAALVSPAVVQLDQVQVAGRDARLVAGVAGPC